MVDKSIFVDWVEFRDIFLKHWRREKLEILSKQKKTTIQGLHS